MQPDRATPDRIGTLSPDQRSLLRRMLSRGGVDPAKLPIPPRVGRDDPLSRAQEAMWFLNHLAPDSAVYNLPSAIRLRGPLNADALHAALIALAQRHAILRTVFESVGGKPRQRVIDDARVELPRVDAADLPRGDASVLEAVERAIEASARASFDFADAPPWRATLYRLGDRDHVLAFVHHHLVWDGWSIGVMVRELQALYAAARVGEAATLEPLAASYGDYARWEREWIGAELLEHRGRWWRERLRGHAELRLPFDRPRRTEPSFRGAVEAFTMPEPPQLAAALEQL
ncbi:MAG: non-ribosomal peptide synthetase, partial [Myxococcales bacterium]|nr:non-ribosomal peptide synthetase [Myxococcales bacterium]